MKSYLKPLPPEPWLTPEICYAFALLCVAVGLLLI